MIGVLGSINLDLVVRAEQLPVPGQTVRGDRLARYPGGKGANQALAVLRAGALLRFSGAVGSDEFAEQALAELKNDGADLSHISVQECATGIAIILLDQKGQNVITIVPGANATVSPDMAHALLQGLQAGDTILLQQEIPAPAIAAALGAAKEKSVATILNVAPIIPETAALAAQADIVIANETELAALMELELDSTTDFAQIARSRAKAHNQTIVLTLGEKGACAATPDGAVYTAAGLMIDPIDTVGAGDTFCGYFAAALDAGQPLPAALEMAAVAGSLACLKPGAQPAIPRAKTVRAAL